MTRDRWSRLAPGVRLGALLALFCVPGAAAQTRLTLRQAIAIGLEEGDRIKAAEAGREAARYRDQAFYSDFLPRLSLSGTVPTYNRSIIQVVQPDGSTLFRPQNLTNSALTATLAQRLPLTGGDLFVSSSLSRLAVSGQDDIKTWSSTPVRIGLRQQLFRPNTAGWDRREQPLRAEVAERQFLEAREDIALEIVGRFFDVHAARAGLDNATTNAAVNDTLYTLNQGRYEVGKIGENDLLQSELALLRARTAVDGARLEYQRALAALRLALGLSPSAEIEIEVEPVVPEVQADTVVAVAEALRNRATVTEAELQHVQADRRVTEAKLTNSPGATIEAAFGFNATGPDVNLAYENLLEARQFTLRVDVPLLQWGAHKESVRAAQADREQAASTRKTALEQTAQDAHFAALELAQARRTLDLSAKADSVAGKRFEVAYNRYVIGRIAIDNLYLAQTEKDQALNQFVQSLRGYWVSFFRLRRLTLFDFEAGRPIR
ncbi:MAG: TolC family protein [Gemmatimonadales bacterium]